MAKGNLSYPSDNNQLPFREIATRTGVLHGLLCDIFMMELQKTEPKLNFTEGMMIYYFGERPIMLSMRSANIQKLFELDYLIGSTQEIKLSKKGMELRNNLDQALGMLVTPANTISVLNELIKTVAVRKKEYVN
jgi:hypothetical protein